MKTVQTKSAKPSKVYFTDFHATPSETLPQKLHRLMKKAGFEQIELTVEAKNTRAQALYRKYGFTVYGTRPHGMKYPDGSYDDDLLMIRML